MKRALFALFLTIWFIGQAYGQVVSVGSKKFTESYVLGEIIRMKLDAAGIEARHRQGIGATSIVWAALRQGEISVYPEYTGTIGEEILKSPERLSLDQLRAQLEPLGIGVSGELGFNNTYALVMRRAHAEELGIRRISDLRQHPGLTVRVSHEFLGRADGWRPLAQRYGLSLAASGIDHGIAYAGLQSGRLDLTDAYSTDWQIGAYDLLVLEDDLGFFPEYEAVLLYRKDLPNQVVNILRELEGTIDERLMIRMNQAAEESGSFAQAASLSFQQAGDAPPSVAEDPLWRNIVRLGVQHLRLVGLSMLLAVSLGVPLGIAASRRGAGSQIILGTVGVVQTIPSLALLALLVPVAWFGITERTAIFALFLYSLLPIVRNTAIGLQTIPGHLREAAAALGLDGWSQMRKVYLPIAFPTILAGIKTSAVINVGTATLAALIAAGGFGEPIIAGLAINDSWMILQGAIPAAALALLVQFLFDALDRLLVPRGLRT
jgi:osmoprotectant transport system permease protein